VYLGRAAFFLVTMSFVAVLYKEARDYRQDRATTRPFCWGWYAAIPTLLAVINVYQCNSDARIVRREVRSGMYAQPIGISPGVYAPRAATDDLPRAV
jgi:hypothetical protein